MRSLLHLTLVTLILLVQQDYSAAQEKLGELALFYRCYGHLTQSRPSSSEPLLAEVKSGNKTALQACTELLDRAKFSAESGTRIQEPNSSTAKAVLSTFHQLHRSWSFEEGVFDPTASENLTGSETWYEDSPFGAYVTRALFAPSTSVSSITSGRTFLQPVRTEMNPVHSYSGVPSTTAGREKEFRLGESHPFAPRGEILGIRQLNITPIQWTRFGDLSSMPDFANIIAAPTATQNITTINFPDLTSVKGPLTEDIQFAIRIRGQLLVPTAGSYTLYIDVNDGGQLFIDGTRVLDKFSTSETDTEASTVRSLTAGSHTLEVRYRQRLTTAKLIFSWQSSAFPKQVVPSSALSNLQAQYYLNGNPQEIKLSGSEGGGFIGDHNYLITTFTEPDQNYVPNGAERTNRSWAKAVLSDAFCRELPVVREVDVEEFVRPNSAVPFRQAAACVTCHATADRQAGLIRNLRWNIFSSLIRPTPYPDLYGLLGMRMIAPSAALSTDWPDSADANYGARPAYGRLFFRNYKGLLIDRVVQTFDELGSAIREQDDHYACFAKRYYQYFTGINVELKDPGDPSYRAPNKSDAHHKNKVINLGLELKRHGSLRQLILDILGSEEYRMTDFGVSYTGK